MEEERSRIILVKNIYRAQCGSRAPNRSIILYSGTSNRFSGILNMRI
jgi:hypothetical protein